MNDPSVIVAARKNAEDVLDRVKRWERCEWATGERVLLGMVRDLARSVVTIADSLASEQEEGSLVDAR